MKIGLLTMSGVRIVDPELAALGLNLPGFVERSQVIASLPSLALLTLAGMTPDDVELEYVEVADVQAAEGLPTDWDLVAISTYTAQAKEAYEVADRLRARGVTVVFGGLHATACPDEALEHADSVVVGEGELTWARLVEDHRAGRLERRYSPRSGEIHDLAEAPMPRFDLLEIPRYNRLTVTTARGCPHRCDFCAASPLLTPGWRPKPVERVIAELHQIRELWDRPFIELADDNTFAEPRRMEGLLMTLRGEGIKWFTETDLSIADHPDLLDLMRESGCRQVLIGIESPTAAGVDGIELRRNWKRQHHDDAEAAIERIQSHGITVNGCFVLGLDGDTEEVFDAVHDFVDRVGLFEVQVTVLTPFPGTPLFARLQREGRILDDTAWEMCTLFDVNHEPLGMSADRLRQGLRDLMARLYEPAFVRSRRERFFHELRRRRLPGVEQQEQEWAHATSVD
jgi:radical SAM superfamily enzyme YgiQ (UPF0313 family)